MNTPTDLPLPLLGVETEHAVHLVTAEGARVPSEEVAAHIIRAVASGEPHLRHEARSGIFLANGSLLYRDPTGFPESCTPECAGPLQVITYQEGDRRRLRQVAAHDFQGRLRVLEGNVCYATRTSRATHLQIETAAGISDVAAQMLPFLVSRILFGGSGGLAPRDGTTFCLAPRLDLFGTLVGGNTESSRPLVLNRSRDAYRGLRRQEFICFENLRSELARYLDYGATQLVMHLVNRSLDPAAGLVLNDPLAALHIFNSDIHCGRHTAPGRLGLAAVELTALDIQWHYLEQVASRLGEPWMPGWAPDLVRRWRGVLERARLGPEALADSLDWAIKWMLFQGSAVAGPLSEPSRKMELDLRFGELGGIFDQMHQGGLLAGHRLPGIDDEAVERAMANPPEESRAGVRGACVRKLGADAQRENYSASWSRILDERNGRVIPLTNPRLTRTPAWRSLPHARRPGLPDPFGPRSRNSFLSWFTERYQRGEFGSLLRMHSISRSLLPDNPELAREFAWVLARTGAGLLARRCLTMSSSCTPLRDRLGDEMLCQRFLCLRPAGPDFHRLIEQAEQFLSASGFDRVIATHAAWLLNREGQPERAVDLLREARSDPARDTYSGRLLCELADACRMTGDPAAAETIGVAESIYGAECANNRADRADWLLTTRAKIEFQRGDPAAAIRTIEEAIAVQRANGSVFPEARSLLLRVRMGGDPAAAAAARERMEALKGRSECLAFDPALAEIEREWEDWVRGGAGGEADVFWRL